MSKIFHTPLERSKKGDRMVTLTCECCNKKFERVLAAHNQNLKLGKKIYCSVRCSTDARRTPKKYCIDCGKEISKRHKDNIRCHSCSKKGILHPNFKGYSRNIYDKIRNHENYKVWRIACFERDNYECIVCGKNNGFHVHHINLLTNLVELNKLTIDVDLGTLDYLWDINNGATLCIKCHKDVHKIIRRF